MNLPDFVTDTVNSVHIIRDAHTAPLLLDHTADNIPTRHMCLLSPFLEREEAWCIFLFLAKPLVYVQPIKVAITKHGFISILLTGAIPGPEKMIMNGIFLSKNGLQIAHTGTKNDVLAKS